MSNANPSPESARGTLSEIGKRLKDAASDAARDLGAVVGSMPTAPPGPIKRYRPSLTSELGMAVTEYGSHPTPENFAKTVRATNRYARQRWSNSQPDKAGAHPVSRMNVESLIKNGTERSNVGPDSTPRLASEKDSSRAILLIAAAAQFMLDIMPNGDRDLDQLEYLSFGPTNPETQAMDMWPWFCEFVDQIRTPVRDLDRAALRPRIAAVFDQRRICPSLAELPRKVPGTKDVLPVNNAAHPYL